MHRTRLTLLCLLVLPIFSFRCGKGRHIQPDAWARALPGQHRPRSCLQAHGQHLPRRRLWGCCRAIQGAAQVGPVGVWQGRRAAQERVGQGQAERGIAGPCEARKARGLSRYMGRIIWLIKARYLSGVATNVCSLCIWSSQQWIMAGTTLHISGLQEGLHERRQEPVQLCECCCQNRALTQQQQQHNQQQLLDCGLQEVG